MANFSQYSTAKCTACIPDCLYKKGIFFSYIISSAECNMLAKKYVSSAGLAWKLELSSLQGPVESHYKCHQWCYIKDNCFPFMYWIIASQEMITKMVIISLLRNIIRDCFPMVRDKIFKPTIWICMKNIICHKLWNYIFAQWMSPISIQVQKVTASCFVLHGWSWKIYAQFCNSYQIRNYMSSEQYCALPASKYEHCGMYVWHILLLWSYYHPCRVKSGSSGTDGMILKRQRLLTGWPCQQYAITHYWQGHLGSLA